MTERPPGGRGRQLCTLVVAALVLAACSGDDSGPSGSPSAPAVASSSSTPDTTAPDTTAPDETEPDATEPAAVERPDPAPSVRSLDCAAQLPGYVESEIPGGVGNPRLTCWAMEVPENYDDPASRRIEVTYYVWASGNPADRPADPVFYAPGGPRGSAFNSLRVFTNRDIQGPRDLVLMDTRGNGPIPGDELGLPLSGCPEVYAAVLEVFSVNEPLADEYAINEAGWQACADRLRDDGWDLDQYRTPAVVDDLEQLRRVLGYEQVNFYGESYSTLYGLQWMRAYPKSLRSVVLDSVVTPDASWSPDSQTAPQRNLLAWVFEQCAASATCNAAHPDRAATLARVVAALDADPHEVEVTSFVTGEAVTASLDGSDVMFIVDGALDPSTITQIPALITAWDNGDYAVLDLFAERFQDNAAGGLMVSGAIVCHDSVEVMTSVDDVAAVEAPWQHVAYLPNMVCPAVGVTPALADFHQPVESDTPVLVVIGELDTATPADGSRAAATTLSAATVVTFDWQGHVPVRSDECARSIVTSFYDNPTAPDTSCVAAANDVPLVFQ